MTRLEKNQPRAAVAPRERLTGCSLHLIEQAEGWRLVVTTDDLDALRILLEPGEHQLPPEAFSMSITPNLVPGEPFGLATLQVSGPRN
jgi:hypothetical protein